MSSIHFLEKTLLSNIPIFVTGGAGYIGSHICKDLAESGYLPISLDDFSKGHRELVQFGPCHQIDICDQKALEVLFSSYHPHAVIHCAGRADVAESLQDPFLYYQINVVGTLALLNVMKQVGVKYLLFSSSCATYGQVEGLSKISEETPQKPTHPYGRSKWMAEQLCLDAFHAYGIIYGFLRYFNAAGADASGVIGEWHEPETHLIPLLLATAKGARRAFSLFGEDYPTPDGSAIRDYIHVTDLSRAHVKALESLLKKNQPLTLNLGSGVGYSVKQMIQAAREVTGCPISVENHPRRAGDPAILIADIKQACTLLDWQPRYCLESILLTAWNWINNNKYF